MEVLLRKLIYFLILILTASLLVSCNIQKTVKVAVFTKLEAGSIIGSSEIDAIRMYLEQHNIKNIEIFPFNDGWDPELIEGVYKEARAKGINIFFTSHTSTCAMELKKFTDQEMDDVIVFITGSMTDLLSNIDDNNIRVTQDVINEQKSIAEELNKYSYKKLLILRESDNFRYTDPAIKYFDENYKNDFEVIDFSASKINMNELYEKVSSINYDASYVLVGGNQALGGSIAQLSWKINPDAKIYLTPWNNAPTFVETAGNAVESCVLGSHYPSKTDYPQLGQYLENFKSHYSYAPTYNSLHIYKAITVLEEALSAGNYTPKEIKAYIIEKKAFDTELGKLNFSSTGDVDMPLYFINNIKEAF